MPLTPAPAVLRAVGVLRHLAEHPATRFTVSELSRLLGVPRATCDTVLLALVDGGLVQRDAELRYALGLGCAVLGDAARVANPALRAAADHADVLARELGAFALVSIRDGNEVRVWDVFDYGPPLGLRARVGQAIPLVAPFGASFAAWSGDREIEDWLGNAEPPLNASETRAYRAALEAVRRRGYSVTVITARQPDLIDALERLAEHRAPDDARQARDEAARQMAHSEHLTAEIDPAGTLRIAQVSAPVFDAERQVAASIMLLGPNHELTGAAVADLGHCVASAATAATAEAGGATAGARRTR
jgi:DNA-binding IclR family transcriptional regulator